MLDGLIKHTRRHIISADNQEDFIAQLNNKRKKLKLKKEYLIEKYDDMYLKLLNSYKELNIHTTHSSIYAPNTNKTMEVYIREIKEIISRNPKYYKFYPPKLGLEDFERIAEDFNIDKSFLAYKMFGETHYERKKEKAEKPYFEIYSEELPEASNFYIMFQDEIDNGIKRIVNKTIHSNTMISDSISEDLFQILRMNIIIRGNNILFHGKDCESKDEYLASIFAYLKAVCDRTCKQFRMTNKSLNDRIKEGSESEFGDFIAGSDTAEDIDSNGEAVENVLQSATDSSDHKIMEDMIRCLQETGNREDALRKLAKEMGISREELQTKLKEIYERLN